MAGRLLRFLLEYVGNVSAGTERRRDARSRLLIDRIQDEMAERGASALDRERTVEDLREAVRSVEAERAG